MKYKRSNSRLSRMHINQSRESWIRGSRLAVLMLITVLFAGSGVGSAASSDSLWEKFMVPPKDAKPLSWWHWVDGNITREGITSDLEAMQEAGLAGAYMFNVGLGLPAGPHRFMSPEWLLLVSHAIKEADRLGLDFGVHNCDGWSQAGGPWITPERSMKRITWSARTLEGPKDFKGMLEQPESDQGFYRDLAVVAFPVPRGERLNGPGSGVEVRGSLSLAELALLMDGDAGTRLEFPGTEEGTDNEILIEFPMEVEVQSLVLHNPGTYRLITFCPGTLEVSDDGADFRRVCDFESNWDTGDAPTGTITVGFESARGKYFRYSFKNKNPFGFGEIELSSQAHPHYWEAKAGWTRQREHGGEAVAYRQSPDPEFVTLPENYVVALKDVRVLRDRMSQDGNFAWAVPEGKWRVMRIGYTSTGKTNTPATDAGVGLECDKLDSQSVRFHLDQYLGRLTKDFKEYVGSSLNAFATDSWESHIQNWTDGLDQRFNDSMGYDLMQYMPLLLEGNVIDSLETSQEMMWDWRRFLANQIRENYFQTVHRFAKEKGLTYVAEGSGRQQYMYDPIAYQRDNDVPMGEFWIENAPGGWVRVDNKIAASAAHITGRRHVASEAYTASPHIANWKNHPYLLKAEGDIAFTKGVNRIIFHTFAHQPFPGIKPGFLMGWFGLHNHQGNTWFRPASAWYRYIARCQFLLQEGRFFADVLYFLGEDVPARVGFRDELYPELPSGYDFDACDAQSLKEAQVKDGIITLPSGMEYSVLLLPEKQKMRPESVARIGELIEAGATVVGRMPVGSPSLSDGAAGDALVQRITKRLTGGRSGERTADISHGRGRLLWGLPFDEVFRRIGISPDFEAQDTNLIYIHRKIDSYDIYFVSNPTAREAGTECRFRITQRQLELWDPNTGERETAACYWQEGEQTVLPLRLAPNGSAFVVFTQKEPSKMIRSISRNGRGVDASSTSIRTFLVDGKLKARIQEPGNYAFDIPGVDKVELTVESLPKDQVLSGPWTIRFPDGWSAPEKAEFQELSSWHEHSHDGIKHFSGTAEYEKSFNYDGFRQDAGKRILLNLGRVEVIAQVSLNGKKLATLWKPPFEVDISDYLKERGNHLSISVTNLWPNRLIGDARFPELVEWERTHPYPTAWPNWLWKNEPVPGQRHTFATRKIYGPDDPLLASGLLGPVRLRTVLIKDVE